MATVYAEVDQFPLSRLAVLVHERVQGDGSATADGEIRQLEDRFGISPLARRRLNWEIDQAQVLDFAREPAPEADPRLSVSERLSGVERLARMARITPSVLQVPGSSEGA